MKSQALFKYWWIFYCNHISFLPSRTIEMYSFILSLSKKSAQMGQWNIFLLIYQFFNSASQLLEQPIQPIRQHFFALFWSAILEIQFLAYVCFAISKCLVLICSFNSLSLLKPTSHDTHLNFFSTPFEWNSFICWINLDFWKKQSLHCGHWKS